MNSWSDYKKVEKLTENMRDTVEVQSNEVIENMNICGPLKELRQCNDEVHKFYEEFELDWGNLPEQVKNEYLVHCEELGRIHYGESTLIERIKWLCKVGKLSIKNKEPCKKGKIKAEEGNEENDAGIQKKRRKIDK